MFLKIAVHVLVQITLMPLSSRWAQHFVETFTLISCTSIHYLNHRTQRVYFWSNFVNLFPLWGCPTMETMTYMYWLKEIDGVSRWLIEKKLLIKQKKNSIYLAVTHITTFLLRMCLKALITPCLTWTSGRLL